MMHGKRLDKKGGWNITIKVGCGKDLPKMLDAIYYWLLKKVRFYFKENQIYIYKP